MSYHFIGIGGIGMSGLARILLQKGKKVSGSDLRASSVTNELEKNGATIFFGQKKEQVKGGAKVVFSTDIKEDNPEYLEAKALGCTMLHRSDLLKELMMTYKPLLVSGTHGKTSTTSLLIHTFQTAGLDPAFSVGGIMHDVELNASSGSGSYFVAEADESDGTFLKYPAFGQIVTNIDSDHLAHYKTFENLKEAFRLFFNEKKEMTHTFYCWDCFQLQKLQPKGISYGFTDGAELLGKNFSQKGFLSSFDIEFQNKCYQDITLSRPGLFNAQNALAVFGLALQCGVSEEAIRKAFQTFSGVKRRLEKIGEKNDILILDDYAHHPTEIRATLEAVRLAAGKKRVIACFQPHRYSRMQHLMDLFTAVFDAADIALITDLYTANEKPIEGISTKSIFDAIKQCHSSKAQFIDRTVLVETLFALVEPGDIVVTLGAGDITQVGPELWQKL